MNATDEVSGRGPQQRHTDPRVTPPHRTPSPAPGARTRTHAHTAHSHTGTMAGAPFAGTMAGAPFASRDHRRLVRLRLVFVVPQIDNFDGV